MQPHDLIVDTALGLAFHAHQGQFRDDGYRPYIVHPIDVMNRVWAFGIRDTRILAASLLHDVVEDTTRTRETIVDQFGEPIADIVDELTFVEPLDAKDKAYAKTEYMKTFMHKSLAALIIKVADRLGNVMDFANAGNKYAAKYYAKAEVLWKALREREDELVLAYGNDLAANIVRAHISVYSEIADDVS